MLNKIRLFFLIFSIVLIGNSLYSQVPGNQKIYTLDECMRTALSKNYDIRNSEAQINSAAANVTSAFGGYLPSVYFSMGYARQLTEVNYFVDSKGQVYQIPPGSGYQNPNSYSMQAYATYNIFDGFSREANFSKAQDNYNASQLNSKFTLESIKIGVYRYYISVIKNSEIVKIRRENLEQGKKELERIQAQYNAGIIPISNVYSQEADLGNLELEVIRSENDLNIAKANLLGFMGLNPTEQADFLESSLPNAINDDEAIKFRSNIGSLPSAIKRAFEYRLDYSSVLSEIAASNSSVKTATSAYFPRISAQGGWQWNNSAFSNFSELGRSYVGLNLQLPIFDNFNTNANIQLAKMNLEQNEVQRLKLEQTIRTNVQTAYLTLDASEKELEITKRSIKSATQNLESAKERFHAGAATITDYLTANTLFITAQINRVNAIYSYVQAQKEVLFAIGNLN